MFVRCLLPVDRVLTQGDCFGWVVNNRLVIGGIICVFGIFAVWPTDALYKEPQSQGDNHHRDDGGHSFAKECGLHFEDRGVHFFQAVLNQYQ